EPDPAGPRPADLQPAQPRPPQRQPAEPHSAGPQPGNLQSPQPQPHPAGSRPAGPQPQVVEPMRLPEGWALCDRVLDQGCRAVVGKRYEACLVVAAGLAGGHVLLEDYPGLGKTLAARSFAQTLGLDFRRLQFTPDMLPSDVTGSFVYDQARGEFAFRPGPLFCGLLLADEINRTPPKTQAALLEAMQEGQSTVEGRTFPLPRPFRVLATPNPPP